MMLKLLAAGNTGFTKSDIERIKSYGYELEILGQEKEEPVSTDYDVVICNFLFVNHDIGKFNRLKAVQLLSAGLDRMPMDYAEEHSIEVRNARGIYSIPIAETVVMATLDTYRQSFFFYENQKRHEWIKKRDLDELSDKTVCIFGTGSVGTEVAKRFSVFTDQVIGVDIKPMERQWFSKVYGLNDAEAALKQSDVVVLTLPLTDQTRHMFSNHLLSIMKDDAVFINVARGGLIDEDALRTCLKHGKFKAVILDVFENEPLDESYWGWDAERVRVIPHNSFVSRRNDERMKEQIMKNLIEWTSKFSGGYK